MSRTCTLRHSFFGRGVMKIKFFLSVNFTKMLLSAEVRRNKELSISQLEYLTILNLNFCTGPLYNIIKGSDEHSFYFKNLIQNISNQAGNLKNFQAAKFNLFI